MTTTTPKHSAALERRVLGGLINGSKLVGHTFAGLTEDDFYPRTHQRIFAAARKRHAERMPIDFALVSGAFAREAEVRDAIAQLPPCADAKHDELVAELKTLAAARRLQEAAHRILADCADHETSASDVVTAAPKLVAAALEALPCAVHTTTLSASVERVVRGIVERQAGVGPKRLATGVDGLDALLGGLEPGRLYVVAGRPGTGKSALAAQLAAAAAHGGARAQIFSLEMSSEEISTRLVSARARVNPRVIDRDKESFVRWAAAAEALAELPLLITEAADLTVDQIRTEARRQSMSGGLQLIVVDYLQLIRGGANDDPRWRVQTVSAVSRGLKSMALELHVPVIAAAQLNRDIEAHGDGVPKLHHLRESGSIEQDADVVVMLHRLGESDRTHCYVRKHRGGPLGMVRLEFRREHTRFDDHNGSPDPSTSQGRRAAGRADPHWADGS